VPSNGTSAAILPKWSIPSILQRRLPRITIENPPVHGR
jgi:hypothetical protein